MIHNYFKKYIKFKHNSCLYQKLHSVNANCKFIKEFFKIITDDMKFYWYEIRVF